MNNYFPKVSNDPETLVDTYLHPISLAQRGLMCDTVNGIKSKHRVKILQYTASILNKMKDPECWHRILTFVTSIQADKRDELLAQTKYFWEKFTTCPDRIRIIETLASIPKKRIEVIDLARLFIIKGDRAYYLAIPPSVAEVTADFACQILKIISNVEDRTELFQLAAPILVGIKDITHWQETVDTLAQIPLKERSQVLKLTKLLWDEHCNSDWLILLRTIHRISKDERNNVVTLAKSWVTKTSHCARVLQTQYTIYKDLLEILSQIPKDERETVLSLAQQISEKFGCPNALHILNAVRNLPQEKRSWVVSLALLLPIQNLDPSYVCQMLRISSNMPQTSESLSIFKHAASLLQGVDFDLWEQILDLITQIPKDEREEVLSLAKFFTKEHSWNPCQNLPRMVEAIISIRKDRKTIFEQAIPSLQCAKSDDERIAILCLLQEIPAGLLDVTDTFMSMPLVAEHQEVLSLAKSFIEPFWNPCQNLTRVVEAIISIGKDRKTIFEHAKPFLKIAQSDDERIAILYLVQKIPNEKRAQFVYKLFMLYLKTDKEDRLGLLNTITQTPHDLNLEQQEKLVQQARLELQKVELIASFSKMTLDASRGFP